MAVHNLQAESLEVSTWLPLDSFPRDGSMVEVLGSDDGVYLAKWSVDSNQVMVAGGCAVQLKAWRKIE